MTKEITKKKKGYPYLWKSLKYFTRYKKLCTLIIIFGILTTTTSVIPAIFSGNVLLHVSTGTWMKAIQYSLYGLLFYVVITLINQFWGMVAVKMRTNVMYDIRKDMIDKILLLKTSNFDKTNSGVFISRINKDASNLADFFDEFISVLSELLGTIGAFIYIFAINIWLSLFLLAEVFIYFIIENYRIKRLFADRKIYKEKDEKLVGLYNETIRGVRDIKGLNLKSEVISRSDTYQKDASDFEYKFSVRNGTLRRVRNLISHIFSFLFVVVWWVLTKNIMLTASSALIVYNMKGRFINVVNYFIQIKEYLNWEI